MQNIVKGAIKYIVNETGNKIKVYGDNLKKKTDNVKHEKLVNLISMAVLVLVTIIVVLNITANKDENGQLNKVEAEMTENVTTTGALVAGIDSEIIKGNADASESMSDMTDEKTQEATQKNTDAGEQDTKVTPAVSSKEYNNVTSGKLAETSYVKSDYFDNTLFLGDSRTVALKKYGFIREENTFAVNGISHIGFLSQQFTDSVTGITGDIFSIVKERKPEKIYIALGVNGVAYLSRSEFMKDYEKLVNNLMEASPESKIIVQCILPVNEATYTGANKNLNNANIDAINAELLKLTEDKGIFYLDIASEMKDANNQLMDVYDVGDGLHYSFTGYSVVYDGICRHGVD